MRKLLLLGFLFAIVGFAQSPPPCGQYAHPILFAGNWYCIPTGGGGAPTGAAGGSLTGTYPNPGVVGFTAGASNPGTCTPGTTLDFFNTTSGAWQYCSATNTWSAGRSIIGSLSVGNNVLGVAPDSYSLGAGASAISRTVTAGAAGATANYITAKDASNPTLYVTSGSGGCGSGFAASTATSGNSFELFGVAGTVVNAVADGTVTAGHLLTGGTSTPGRVADTGQTARSSVSATTCIVGVALSSATVGGALTVVYDGPGSYGASPAGVTSATIAGTANQITATGTCTITSTGTCTLSLPSAVTLSAPGTASSITFGNATSGALTLQTVTGALGTVTASLPANTGTIAELNLAQTWTAQQIINATAAGGGALALLVAPAATANYGTLSIGSGAFDGSTTGHFAGSSSGTQIAVNAASGYTGNMIDLQVAGSSVFKVTNTGVILPNSGAYVAGAGRVQLYDNYPNGTLISNGDSGGISIVGHNSSSGVSVGVGNAAYACGSTVCLLDATTSTGTTRINMILGAADTTATNIVTIGGSATINGTKITSPNLAGTGTGDVSLCWTTAGVFTQGSVCGTSLAEYKTNVQPLAHGLDYLMQMKPVTFSWKDNGNPDLGMIADEVAAIDPLLGAYRADGSLYNFRDRPVLAVLVKAMQEIEVQIKTLEAR